MLMIPFLGIFMGMALWSQWFPIPGFTHPEQSFLRRLSGTTQLTIDSWAFYNLVDAYAPQGSNGDQPVVNTVVDHGYANSTEETPLLVSIPVSSGTSDRVTSSALVEYIDIHSLGSSPGQGLYAWLWNLGCFVFCVGLLLLPVAYKRLVVPALEYMIEQILKFFDDQPQTARVHYAADEDSYSFDEEMDSLIAGQRRMDDEGLAWLMDELYGINSDFYASVRARYESTRAHRDTIYRDEQALDSVLDCNETAPVHDTYDVRANSVSRNPWNSASIYASDQDDTPAPAESLNGNGANIAGWASTPTKKRKKNRPSQAARSRHLKKARRESEKELQQAASGSTVPASSASGASPVTSPLSTPFSALAPVFNPGRLAEQEPQSGPLSPAPLSVQMDDVTPMDCGTTSDEGNTSPQRSSRCHRRRQRPA